MIFENEEEMDEEFYKTHDCLSDDTDKEVERIVRWAEDNGHELKTN